MSYINTDINYFNDVSKKLFLVLRPVLIKLKILSIINI